MKKVELRGKRGVGKFAIVDDQDFDRVSNRSWHVCTSGYPTWDSKGKTTLLHRFILGTSEDAGRNEIDHINRNKLDNRKANLRFCSHSTNMVNRATKGDRINMRNISRHEHGWQVQLNRDKKKIR